MDDLVQDVFLRAHTRLADLQDPDAIKGWLATITVRLAARRLKRRRFKLLLGLDRECEYADLVDPALSPEQTLMLVDAFRALDRVSSGQRVAWSLRYLHGEPLVRVASLCGCSLATAKRWITVAHEAVTAESLP